jgi:adenine-specific DNA methylase
MDTSFPQTRYQGSKRKLIEFLLRNFRGIVFESALDAFGGTGAVSYLLKQMGKDVIYNDLLISNWYIAKALIENHSINFDIGKIPYLFEKKSDIKYRTVIQDNFEGIYYLNEENKTLDILVQNIFKLKNQYEKALCFFALFQACIQKRPFNLFHRKNLNLRLNNVSRSFGNKKTWDTPFIELFQRAIQEANSAVFNNSRLNRVINHSIVDIPIPKDGIDLVYLDPPYISEQGVGVDYKGNYHFLEGICNYFEWENMIDYNSKHRRLRVDSNKWTDPKKFLDVFEETIKKFKDFKIVLSYRSPGIPTIEELKGILTSYLDKVLVQKKDYKYALTSKQKRVNEVLFVCE